MLLAWTGLNTVRISKKKHWKFKQFELPRMPQSTPFSRQLFNSITLSPLKTAAYLNPLWRKKTMYKRPSLFISASWNVDNFQAWKMMKVQKYWQNSKTGTFHNTHLRESNIFWWPQKKIFWIALVNYAGKSSDLHLVTISEEICLRRVEIRASSKKWPPKKENLMILMLSSMGTQTLSQSPTSLSNHFFSSP